jgi:lipid-binding SYLF domain-containing protein
MKNKKKFFRRISVVCFSTLFIIILAIPVLADDVSDSKQLVEKAVMTFDDFAKAPEMNAFRALVKKAKGVLIVPQFLKGAFVVGGAGGTGLLVARDAKTGQWKGPAFYTIGEGSFGLQAGAEASELILLAMTERGVMALLSSSAKLGADANVTAGPVGVGVAASTANLSVDILSFSRSKGLFAGVAVDGAVVAVRNGLNHAYYGKMCSPTDIVIRKSVSNAHARTLLERVTRAGKE